MAKVEPRGKHEAALCTWCMYVCNTVRTKKSPRHRAVSYFPDAFLCSLPVENKLFFCSVCLFSPSAIIFLFPLFVTLHYFWCCNSHLFPLLSSCLPLFHFLILSFTLLWLFFGPFSVGFERIPRRDSLL